VYVVYPLQAARCILHSEYSMNYHPVYMHPVQLCGTPLLTATRVATCLITHTVHMTAHMCTHNVSLYGGESGTIYNLCLILKIMLQKLC